MNLKLLNSKFSLERISESNSTNSNNKKIVKYEYVICCYLWLFQVWLHLMFTRRYFLMWAYQLLQNQRYVDQVSTVQAYICLEMQPPTKSIKPIARAWEDEDHGLLKSLHAVPLKLLQSVNRASDFPPQYYMRSIKLLPCIASINNISCFPEIYIVN